MNELKKKYIMIYLKRNALLTLGIALPISLVFMVVSLIYDVYPHDIWSSFIPVVIGFLCFLGSSIFVCRFLWLIEKQEEQFNIVFNDENVKQIKGTVTFLSEDWLIHAGSCAFYRGYIKSFSSKLYYGVRGGSGYKIIVKTIDGKRYSFWTMSSSDIVRYRKWLKRSA